MARGREVGGWWMGRGGRRVVCAIAIRLVFLFSLSKGLEREERARESEREQERGQER